MNEVEYRAFYDRVGKLNGWNFSKVKCISEGAAWNFQQEVSRRCKKSDILLDIGTGGGEALLSIADAAMLLVGVDNSAGMVEAAHANVRRSSVSNVRILQMDASELVFPERFFNVVSCRHSPFSASEAARVLVDGGVFLTQQVSEHDKLNLVQAFGRRRITVEDGALMKKYMIELHEAGFREIQSYEYDAAEYYETYEDLLFLLKHTPIVPDFGSREDDFAVLDQFIKDHSTNKGIRTNSKRFMIVART
ncbi:class I SAM-dependent methyltransferase [Paenibacillus marinisediminis]